MLPDKDPKIALAEKTLNEPVNIEDASYEELIRVPGIGLKTAQKIIEIRESKKLDSKIMKRNGVIMSRAAPFIKINGMMQKRLEAFA